MQTAEFLKKAKPQDASRLKVSIVAARFHSEITNSMVEGALKALKEWKVKEKNITVRRVYGSFDLPYAAALAIKKDRPHTVVAIGCIVKGETKHDEYIAHALAQGLTNLSIRHVIPVAFGVITVNTLQQAKQRSRGNTNHAEKATVAALEAALLK